MSNLILFVLKLYPVEKLIIFNYLIILLMWPKSGATHTRVLLLRQSKNSCLVRYNM